MRKLALVLLVAGCTDPLKADVEMFCSATVGTTFKSYNEVGPSVAKRIKSDEFRALFLRPVRNAMTIWEFDEEFRKLMKKTGVHRCKTLEDIVRPPPTS